MLVAYFGEENGFMKSFSGRYGLNSRSKGDGEFVACDTIYHSYCVRRINESYHLSLNPMILPLDPSPEDLS